MGSISKSLEKSLRISLQLNYSKTWFLGLDYKTLLKIKETCFQEKDYKTWLSSQSLAFFLQPL